MRCPQCQLENRAEARFCRGCGAALPRACPSCGAEAPSDGAFCDHCGARLAPAEAPVSPPAPAAPAAPRTPASYTPRHLADRILTTRAALEGERKHVTVLFADCAGFTALAEKLDPEDVHGIMERCFRVILDEVHRYEGTVNQFTGDGVMALFGAPVALEDAPRRAVLAALGIHRALESLGADLREARGIDFRMRIGIHTGLVVVGKIGDDLRMDYTAVGDTTNLAARLQTLARPGSILISGATRKLVEGFFELRDLGALEVKGKRRPVRAFEVLAESAAHGRIDVLADSELTPLVGRARELEALQDAFERAREGSGQVVFLVGEAGLGKSRLLHEFRRRLAAAPHLWIEGHCASYGRATAFLPIAEGMRRYFGIEDRDADAEAIAKVERGIEAFGEDLRWTLPFVRGMLSLATGDPAVEAMDAVTRRSETFRALKALTLRSAETNPLVLLVEDLHWIDPASEEYLSFLSDAVAGTRALLICSHRPGYRHPFGDRSYHTRIAIRALTDAEMASMTTAMLGTSEIPGDLRELIARKAEGNPFFVEEVTKSLLEEGALRREHGRIELSRDMADVIIPDRIQDVIMARIDRLSDDRKHAIQLASVIGREFVLRLLERITELGDAVGPLVEELRGLELVYEKAAHPELAYMFKHALTHDVAYGSILIQRRKGLHRAIGSAIEELYADRLAEHTETLAHHFTLGEDWERALLYRERAVEKALASYANHAAAEHARRALEIARRLGERVPRQRLAHLEKVLGRALFFVSEFRASGDAYRRAAALSDEPSERATGLGSAAMSYVWAHAYPEARAAIDEAIAIARAHNLPTAEGIALGADWFIHAVHGELDVAQQRLDEARACAERAGTQDVRAMMLHASVEQTEWRGDFRAAAGYARETIEIARQLGMTHFVIWPKWFLGKALCCLGDYGRALEELHGAHDLCERIGDRAWRTRLLNTLGWCFAEFGSHRTAQGYNERASRIARDIGDPEITANAEINLALNRLALGDPEGALGSLEVIRAGLAGGDPFMRWRYSLHVFDALAQVALARGDPERALPLAGEELAGARKHGARKLEARALATRGRSLLAMDRRAEAVAACGEALALAEAIGYRAGVWRCHGLLAELARREGKRENAERHVALLRATVESLAGTLPGGELRRDLGAAAEGIIPGA